MNNILDVGVLNAEIEFNFVRSSGPGGQNVNKVNTKVEIRFNVNNSSILTQGQKELITEKLSHKINNQGYLVIISQNKRSQLGNKTKALEKFYEEINRALKPKKKRKKTQPTSESIERRLKEKRENSDKKKRRNENPDL